VTAVLAVEVLGKLVTVRVQELQELQIPEVVAAVVVVRVLEQDQQDHTKEATAAPVLL
jgi:Na+/glutamate symporter